MKREDFMAATLMFIIMVVLFIMGAKPVHAQNFTVEGKTYVAKKSVNAKTKAEPIKTAFTYTDTKGNNYPIYRSSTGSCFVIKTSKNTGKEYRNYLGVEISKDICSKIGVEYKGKGGNKNDK